MDLRCLEHSQACAAIHVVAIHAMADASARANEVIELRDFDAMQSPELAPF